MSQTKQVVDIGISLQRLLQFRYSMINLNRGKNFLVIYKKRLIGMS